MTRKMKVRTHNEWFRPVSLGNRKSCPTCCLKLLPEESVWSWGEYVRAKWRTVAYFCKQCFESRVRTPLVAHGGDCGCEINLVGYHCKLPDWLALPEKEEACGGQAVAVGR